MVNGSIMVGYRREKQHVHAEKVSQGGASVRMIIKVAHIYH